MMNEKNELMGDLFDEYREIQESEEWEDFEPNELTDEDLDNWASFYESEYPKD